MKVTLKELDKYRGLVGKIRANRDLALYYREQAISISQQYSDLPGAHSASDKIGKLVSIYTDLEKKALEREMQAAEEIQRIDLFIAAIPDSITHDVFVYRFQMGLEWRDVAMKMSNSEYSVKKRCYRYIESQQ